MHFLKILVLTGAVGTMEENCALTYASRVWVGMLALTCSSLNFMSFRSVLRLRLISSFLLL